jgi:hypothetical protein
VGLYTVGAQRASRQLPIKLLDAQWGVKPSGLAFSPDGSMLSAMFEQQGNALICTWRIPFGKEVPPLLYPAGALSDAPPAATGDLFGWIPGSAAWLVHGADIVDIASGRVIGQTGLRAAASQHLCPAGDVQIVQTDPAGQTRLMQVMLDAGRLPAFKP